MDGQIEDLLCSVQVVSEYLGAPVHTIYAWRSAGTGPPGRWDGKRLRYRPQDVRDWVGVAPDVSRGMKQLGLGEHGQISITRKAPPTWRTPGTAITPGEGIE